MWIPEELTLKFKQNLFIETYHHVISPWKFPFGWDLVQREKNLKKYIANMNFGPLVGNG